MKNTSRNNNSSAGKKKGSQDQAQAKELKEKRDKAAEAAGKEREILYQVVTPRDSDIIKAYITFTYRVLHPRVTGRMVFYGLLIFVPGFFIKIKALSIACFAIGALVILLGLFRQYISLAITKSNDPDYKSGAIFTYEFTDKDASFYRNGEISSYLSKYKDIQNFFYDEKYYYLIIANRDFFILPKSKFTIGDESTFEDFIYKRSKKTCRWIPNNFRDKMKQRRAYRAVSSNQKK